MRCTTGLGKGYNNNNKMSTKDDLPTSFFHILQQDVQGICAPAHSRIPWWQFEDGKGNRNFSHNYPITMTHVDKFFQALYKTNYQARTVRANMAWFKFLLLTSFTMAEAASLGLRDACEYGCVLSLMTTDLRSALLLVNHFANLEIETKLRLVTRRTTSALYSYTVKLASV